MRSSDILRYGLWAAVLGTALRNRKEYGVPTAWLTHLAGNTATLLLPDLIRLFHKLPTTALPHALQPFVRTLDHRVRTDPKYAGYVAPLALGFIASHPDYSIYHGRWAERTLFGFGLDSLPHAAAAYALARLTSETVATLQQELPSSHLCAAPVDWATRHVDALGTLAVATVTLLWEIGEYRAHIAELEATGRAPEEINMQWSWPDTVTDSIANLLGLLTAVAVRRSRATTSPARRHATSNIVLKRWQWTSTTPETRTDAGSGTPQPSDLHITEIAH